MRVLTFILRIAMIGVWVLWIYNLTDSQLPKIANIAFNVMMIFMLCTHALLLWVIKSAVKAKGGELTALEKLLVIATGTFELMVLKKKYLAVEEPPAASQG